MHAPVREGTRGGQGDFKWSDVKDDKDRENYLGHSILAPKGRWQNNRDVTWYTKDKTLAEEERAAEIKHIKELEEDALSVALGFTPVVRAPSGPSTSTGPPPLTAEEQALEKARAKEVHRREKDERKKERASRREEKAIKRREGKDKKEHRPRGTEEEERKPSRDERGRDSESRREDYSGRDGARERERDGRWEDRDRSRSPRRN